MHATHPAATPAEPNSRQAGYSVLEMLTALVVSILILIGTLNVFEMTSRVGRIQTGVADLQQSMRVAQHDMVKMLRMAGRGGLQRGIYPNGTAVRVINNIGDGGGSREIAPGYTDSPEAALGTDVLIVRGVFSQPLYQVDPSSTTNFTLNGSPPTDGQLIILDRTPTGVPLDLSPLEEVADRPEALLLVSPLGEYAVVELDPGNSVFDKVGSEIVRATLQFKISGGTHTAGYTALNPGGVYSSTLKNVAFAGILEEYRFYVRDDSSPTLSRARVFPGTDTAYQDEVANLSEDIADNVVGLQVALAIDLSRDGAITADEWLYDASDDDPTAVTWNNLAPTPPPLRYVRLNTLTRTDQPDPGYVDAPVAQIEDKNFGETADPADETERLDRRYRRRLLQTTVDLRNI